MIFTVISGNRSNTLANEVLVIGLCLIDIDALKNRSPFFELAM
jgi:hypothetical protein